MSVFGMMVQGFLLAEASRAALHTMFLEDYFASQMRDNPMVIHLVGETIDARRAHKRAQAGELVQLVRGVYIEQDVNADAAILSHAVRSAHYLYPNAFLSSASATLLAPTSDGRLFISVNRPGFTGEFLV